jgi:hypothetical protein
VTAVISICRSHAARRLHRGAVMIDRLRARISQPILFFPMLAALAVLSV